MFTKTRVLTSLTLIGALTLLWDSGLNLTTAAPPAAIGPGEPACQVFPPNNPWNTDISGYPLHPQSDAYVNQIGRSGHLHPDFGTWWEGAPIGIPYVLVGAGQPKVPVSFDYADESDPGPYPIPPDAPIEGGPGSDGDRHVLVIDNSTCTLYEMFYAHPQNGGQSWTAGSGAVFDLNTNALRPDYWTSADAAGLPIFPGLVRYSEVIEQGVIDHALRFTIAETRRAFIHPATHYASSNTNPGVPPMGLRFRMKAGYNCGGFSHEVQVICAALKKYGMFVADNGSDWYVSGAPDDRWNDDALGDLKQITGDAFEVVNTGEPIITESGPEFPPPAPPAAPPPPAPPAPPPPPPAPAAPPQAPGTQPQGQAPAPAGTIGTGDLSPTSGTSDPANVATPGSTEPATPRELPPGPSRTNSANPATSVNGGDSDGGLALGLIASSLVILSTAAGAAFYYARRHQTPRAPNEAPSS